MAEEKKEPKKIIIDEDWKQQARREKDILHAQEEQDKPDPAARPPLPRGDFTAMASMLFTQALFAMGILRPEGETEKNPPDLQAAKYHIDMLETLEEKTSGNLTEQEKKLLDDTLSQARLAFVKVSG